MRGINPFGRQGIAGSLEKKWHTQVQWVISFCSCLDTTPFEGTPGAGVGRYTYIHHTSQKLLRGSPDYTGPIASSRLSGLLEVKDTMTTFEVGDQGKGLTGIYFSNLSKVLPITTEFYAGGTDF